MPSPQFRSHAAKLSSYSALVKLGQQKFCRTFWRNRCGAVRANPVSISTDCASPTDDLVAQELIMSIVKVLF
jgi:hypothetical protein